MRVLRAETYPILIGDDTFDEFLSYLRSPEVRDSKILVLVDENTRKFCLPVLFERLDLLREYTVIELPCGEDRKDLMTCNELWQNLIRLKADKNTILINLGGGVLTDLAGFVAATYKRGIRFINVPTTLVGQIDASIGGKVGVNLMELKNQVGVFANPDAVYIIPLFLKTLPPKEMQSGFAEIIKYALIMDQRFWDSIRHLGFHQIADWEELIQRSAGIKNSIVKNDPYDRRLRKRLNFGHTIGHAFETLALLQKDRSMSHGIAIAMGMICETFLSSKVKGLQWEVMEEIASFILKNFPYYPISEEDLGIMLGIIQHDKKNRGDLINFTLIPSLGHAIIDQWCTETDVLQSLHFYRELD